MKPNVSILLVLRPVSLVLLTVRIWEQSIQLELSFKVDWMKIEVDVSFQRARLAFILNLLNRTFDKSFQKCLRPKPIRCNKFGGLS